MSALLPVKGWEDILPGYRATPVADLLIGMCMDNRIVLRIPDNFAFVLRAGGANLQRIEFQVSYAVAVGGVGTICLIGHDQCGMVDLHGRREIFVSGLVENGGWERREAEQHFDRFSAVFEIRDPVEFILSEARRLRERYPRVLVAPLFYQVDEGLLYQIAE